MPGLIIYSSRETTAVIRERERESSVPYQHKILHNTWISYSIGELQGVLILMTLKIQNLGRNLLSNNPLKDSRIAFLLN